MFKLLTAVGIIQLVTCRPFEFPELQRTNDPLILTPFIEAGRIEEAQKLSRVNFTESLGVKSYSGFFTVNKRYDSNQFFWYFPPLSNNENVPVILWLQGGPGMSSLIGLILENGPIEVKNNQTRKRPYNWALDHHLIYIDNPVGAGFSFTNSSDGYATNEEQVGRELYQSVVQFFNLFPHLRNNSFFVTGESYAGKYVPALCHTIHKMNKQADAAINLAGFAIGNGWSDPVNQLDNGQFAYQIGLIDAKTLGETDALKHMVINYIKRKNWLRALETMYQLLNMIGDAAGDIDPFNFLQHEKDLSSLDYEYSYLTILNENRDGLHVGNSEYNYDNVEYRDYLKYDMMQSVAPWISELLLYYRGLIYSGQLDTIVPYAVTLNFLQQLQFSAADEYRTASRHIWKVDGEVAGYAKVAGNLTEVLVRNAGHMVPLDQPKFALDLITKFVRNQALYEDEQL